MSKSFLGANKSNKIQRILLLIIITLIFIQQTPYINSSLYGSIRIILYVMLITISLISAASVKYNKHNRFIMYFLILILYSAGIYLIASQTASSFSLTELLVPFGIFIFGYSLNLDRKELYRYLIIYVVYSILLSIAIIIFYDVGISITSNYFLSTKNQIGPITCYASIIALFFSLYSNKVFIKNNKMKSLIFFIFYISLLIFILIIRNRSGLISVSIASIILLVYRLKGVRSKKVLLTSTIMLFGALVVLLVSGTLEIIFNFVYDSIFLNYDFTDINSISAGRINGYINALSYLDGNLIFGELIGNACSTVPHNYVLNLVVELGVVLSIPMLILYFSLWYFVIKFSVTKKQKSYLGLLLMGMMLISLILSLFEYTYPYGPGVAQFILWLLFGYFYRQQRNIGGSNG